MTSSRQRQTIYPADPNCRGLILMIFVENSRNSPHAQSDLISATANRIPIGSKLKRPFFDDFWRKSPEVIQTGSDLSSATMNDRPVGKKLKRPTFDDFSREITNITTDRIWPYLGNVKPCTQRFPTVMGSFWWFLKKTPEKYPRLEVALSRQRQTLDPSDQTCNGVLFKKNAVNCPRPEVTVSRQLRIIYQSDPN